MSPTPEWTAADEDDDARARSSFDRADNTARLALEVADLKRDALAEAEAYRAMFARAEAAEAEVRDLRAKVGEVAQRLIDEAAHLRDVQARSVLIAASRAVDGAALASVGRTEPEGAGA